MLKVNDCYGYTIVLRHTSIVSLYSYGKKTKVILNHHPFELVLNNNIEVISCLLEKCHDAEIQTLKS